MELGNDFSSIARHVFELCSHMSELASSQVIGVAFAGAPNAYLASFWRHCFPVAETIPSPSRNRAPEMLLETKNRLSAFFPVAADFSSSRGSTRLPLTSHCSNIPGTTSLPVTSHFSPYSGRSGGLFRNTRQIRPCILFFRSQPIVVGDPRDTSSRTPDWWPTHLRVPRFP
jgi:hypothetical protein